jgi:hypothetical protein
LAAGDSAVKICSDALILLGAKPISSFNDGTDESGACDRLYPNVRDMALSVYPWSFSYKKTSIARLITTPNSEWKYEFQLPGDRLGNPRAVFTSNQPHARPFKEWEIIGDKLMSNELALWIDYPFQTEEFAMPQYFIQLLKYMMAWHLAYPISEQQDKALYWQAVAVGSPGENGRGGYLRQAMNMDGYGKPTQAIEDFTLIDARF